MFEEVTKREGGRRAARRSVWLVLSTAVQIALGAGLVLSVSLARREVDQKVVDVKFLRVAAPGSAPAAPPPPPAAPKTEPPPHRPKVLKRRSMAMVQPKAIPTELKPPDPSPPPPEEAGEGVEGGVVGGVAGGVVDAPAPPPEPTPPPPPPAPPKPAGPVHFDGTMAAPVKIEAPALAYTEQALAHEVQGTMVVECTVKMDGSVTDCRILKGLPFMDKAVIENLERARFKPATQAGRPLDVRYTFTIKLTLPN
ncbi:MAG TPA: energy transducer TonB [Anaeromyxobacteraceae bacterium]|nr:energy transducer TonB [Anaeromyxobacteraceae bacterium]